MLMPNNQISRVRDTLNQKHHHVRTKFPIDARIYKKDPEGNYVTWMMNDGKFSLARDIRFQLDACLALKVRMKINGAPEFTTPVLGHLVGVHEAGDSTTLILAPLNLRTRYLIHLDEFHQTESLAAFLEQDYTLVRLSDVLAYKFYGQN